MAYGIAQIECCYWDLGRLKDVCGEAACLSMRDRIWPGILVLRRTSMGTVRKIDLKPRQIR